MGILYIIGTEVTNIALLVWVLQKYRNREIFRNACYFQASGQVHNFPGILRFPLGRMPYAFRRHLRIYIICILKYKLNFEI